MHIFPENAHKKAGDGGLVTSVVCVHDQHLTTAFFSL